MKYQLIIIALLASCASHNVSTDSKNESNPKIRMAITVDDLPSHGPLPEGTSQLDVAKKMIAAFKKHGVPEVYGFINAKKTDQNPELTQVLKLWVASGYPLGNHTYTHKKLNDVTVQEYIQDIDLNEKTLQANNQNYDWKYFRYPYLSEGDTAEKRNTIRDHLHGKGYKIAQVSVDFKDWAWNDPYARCVKSNDQQQIKWLKDSYLQNAADQLHQEKKLSQALFHRQISHILLLHIGAFDAEMLDDLLKLYVKEGVEFIPLSEAVKDKAYSEDAKVQASPWGAVFSYQIMKTRGKTLSDFGLELLEDYPKLDLSISCKN